MAQPINAADPLFIAGEVHALITFAQVLATIYPDRSRLLFEFQAAAQVGLAKTENLLAGENLVLGYQHIIELIRGVLETPQDNR